MHKNPAIATFTTLWGLAACFHTEWGGPIDSTQIFTVVVLAAAGHAILRPYKWVSLPLLAGAQLVDVLASLPTPTNHWLLSGFINIGVIIAVVQIRRQPEADRGSRAARFLESLLPAARLGTATFYLFTGFWKLNSGYFDPEHGCGAVYARDVLRAVLGESLTGVAPSLSTLIVAYELVLPAVLLWPRTRHYAALTAVVFHFGLALHVEKTFLNFSSTMFALLTLFNLGIGNYLETWKTGRRTLIAVGAAFLVLAPLAQVVQLRGVYVAGRWLLFLPVAIVVLRGAFRAVLDQRSESDTAWALPSGWQWLPVLLITLNGLAPIAGLKTRCAWQMYSNIRLTEADSNHYLLPASLDAWGYLEDRVTLEASSDPQVQKLAEVDAELPMIELRRWAHSRMSFSVTYVHRGRRVTVEDSRSDPAIPPVSLPERWLTTFDPIVRGTPACTW